MRKYMILLLVMCLIVSTPVEAKRKRKARFIPVHRRITENGPMKEHLTKQGGVFYGPSGRETYYNLPMTGVVSMMRSRGYSEKGYPYWVRSDGVKMFGPYVMIAAHLGLRPKGTRLRTSLGDAIVCDTGGFARWNPTGIDIATAW